MNDNNLEAAMCIVIAIMLFLAFVGVAGEKLLPDADDCAARNMASDCWKGNTGSWLVP